MIGTEDRTTRAQLSPAPSAGPNGKTQTTTTQGTRGNDTDIANQLGEALRRQGQEDLSNVRVTVDQGVAHLAGTTPNIAGKALAEYLARSVPSVRSITNDVMPDTTLRARIEAELAENPKTALEPVDVVVRSGVVTLIGRVSSVEAKTAAETVARSAAGSSVVLNELEVCPTEDLAEALRPVWLWKPD